MRGSKNNTVAFRCDIGTLKEARSLSCENCVDFSFYIVASLVHYFYAKVRQGELECPGFMRSTLCDHREKMQMRV